MPPALQSASGVLLLLALAWAFSENRARLPWRILLSGLALQFAFAGALLWVPAFKGVFIGLNDLLLSLEEATRAGTTFVFGYLGGGDLPFEESGAGTSFILAFRALPLILLMSALSSLLFYWRVRPYLKAMSRSELFTLMTTGMATIAGTVMVIYASILREVLPDALGQILIASLISAPAAIVVAQVLIPPAGEATAGELAPPQRASGSMDAITRGTLQGVELLINITAMLIVMIALVSLANLLIGLLPDVNGAALTLQRLLGWLLAPVVWLMGIPWDQAVTGGSLLGTKVILNEFIAYVDLAALPDGALDARSRLIMVYALCGFANFGSLGIMIGGLGTMAPERRAEIVALGLRSIVAGTLATCLTGAVVGVLI